MKSEKEQDIRCFSRRPARTARARGMQNVGFAPVRGTQNVGFAPVRGTQNVGFAPVRGTQNVGFAPVLCVRGALWAKRLLIFVMAGLFAVLPVWTLGRSILSVVLDRSGQVSSAAAFDEEEEASETASLHRAELEIRATQELHRAKAPAEVASSRRLVEADQIRLGRKWAAYWAPPRGPPFRLLN